MLLVEQNAQQALSRSDRAYILETGDVDPHRRCAGDLLEGRQHSGRLPRRGLTADHHIRRHRTGGVAVDLTGRDRPRAFL